MTKMCCPDSLPRTSRELKANSIGQVEGCPKRAKLVRVEVLRRTFPTFSSNQKSGQLGCATEKGIVSLTIEEVAHGSRTTVR